MSIQKLIMCPRCGGELGGQFKCEKCGAAYEKRLGVYNLLYEDLDEDYIFSTWTIDENEIEETIRQYAEFEKEYRAALTEECRAAEAEQDAHVQAVVEKLEGTVVDIATGRGMFLAKVMEWNPKLHLIGTDIDARVLAVTRRVRHCGENVDFLGCDGSRLDI